MLSQPRDQAVVDRRRVGAEPFGELQRDPLGRGEHLVAAMVGNRQEQVLGDAGGDRLRRTPRQTDVARVDLGDAHAHQLVQPPVEPAVPHRLVVGGHRLRQLRSQ